MDGLENLGALCEEYLGDKPGFEPAQVVNPAIPELGNLIDDLEIDDSLVKNILELNADYTDFIAISDEWSKVSSNPFKRLLPIRNIAELRESIGKELGLDLSGNKDMAFADMFYNGKSTMFYDGTLNPGFLERFYSRKAELGLSGVPDEVLFEQFRTDMCNLCFSGNVIHDRYEIASSMFFLETGRYMIEGVQTDTKDDKDFKRILKKCGSGDDFIHKILIERKECKSDDGIYHPSISVGFDVPNINGNYTRIARFSFGKDLFSNIGECSLEDPYAGVKALPKDYKQDVLAMLSYVPTLCESMLIRIRDGPSVPR